MYRNILWKPLHSSRALPTDTGSPGESDQNAEANLKKVEASYMIVDAKVKVIGKFISLMVEGLEQVGSFAMRTFWIPVIFPYVALIILLLGNYLVKF